MTEFSFIGSTIQNFVECRNVLFQFKIFIVTSAGLYCPGWLHHSCNTPPLPTTPLIICNTEMIISRYSGMSEAKSINRQKKSVYQKMEKLRAYFIS
jgi:hypothetical protein